MTKTLLALLLALGVSLAAPTALAHKTAYTPDGGIKIVWGFLNEPATTFSKTGLDLILTDNATGAPIAGAETTLRATLRLADQQHAFELRAQHGQQGRYTDVVTLTRPGLYVLHLSGTINGTAVDIAIPGAHAIEGIEETYFPPMQSSEARIAALEQQVAALDAKVKAASSTPAKVTEQPTKGVPAPGLFGLVALAALAAIVLRRRT